MDDFHISTPALPMQPPERPPLVSLPFRRAKILTVSHEELLSAHDGDLHVENSGITWDVHWRTMKNHGSPLAL